MSEGVLLVCVCVFKIFSCIFLIWFSFGASEEDNANLKPQRRWRFRCSFCLFLSLCGLLEARLARGCRPERERQELLRIYQEQKGMMGKVCVWDRFVLIGGFSGASGREKLQSGIKRAVSAHFLFPEDKIKAGNAFVSDWPEPICRRAIEQMRAVPLKKCPIHFKLKTIKSKN